MDSVSPPVLYQWQLREPGKKRPRILTWRMTEESTAAWSQREGSK